MKKLFILITIIGISFIAKAQKSIPDYKAMMNDPSVNFYDVVEAAESYFSSIDRSKKGSGWKPFQRWMYDNEYKYYPTGDRSQVKPDFASRAYESFTRKNESADRNLYPNGWVELGPWAVDSITGHYAAGLGRVEDMYISPTDPNLLYLGSRSGGFWKSTNGGISWSGGSTDFLPASGVNAISVSPMDANTILINVRNASNGYSHGIYRSTDGGNSWALSNFNPANVSFGGLGSDFQIYTIAYHPYVPNLIFIGTSKGIYRSDDNLNTWTRLINSGDIYQIAFHPTDANIIYTYDAYYWATSTENQIYISNDQGISYTLSNTLANNNGSKSIKISTSPTCPDCVWVGSSNGVWKSNDKGQNFTFLTNPSQSCGGFAVSDLDQTKMVYGYVDLMNSTDGGSTFNQVTYWSLGNTNGAGSGHQNSYNTSTNYVHADLNNLKCVNGVFYAATDGFLAKSEDNGTTWTKLDDGLAIRENYCLGLSQNNTFVSISGSQDNGTSIKLEDTWIEFYGADGMEGIIYPLNEDMMIGSFQNGGRQKTINRGQSSTGVTPSGSSNGSWVAPLAYDPNDHFRVYDFRNEVYRSDDFADTYTQLGAPSSFSGSIQNAAIAENNSDIIIISKGQGIDKSIDGGLTFSSIHNNLPSHSISDIAFDPSDDNTIIVTNARYENNGEKVYITTDGGLTWTNITYNLGDMPIKSVVIDHTPERNIYLGAEIGIYTKSMDATTWNLYNSDLPNVAVNELEINYGSNTLKAATWGRGLWEYALVGRQDYPAITHTQIDDSPTLSTPKESIEQYVTSKIHYEGTLSSVFTQWSIDNPSFDHTINMALISDTTWRTITPLPDYPAGTNMYFKVLAVGSNLDTTETYKFMYTVRPFEYCDASGSSDNGNLYISNVNIQPNDILNNSTGNTTYTIYDETPIVLSKDTEYTISVINNTGWSENDNAVWIDYDNNREFASTENILLAPNTGVNSFANFSTIEDAIVNDTIFMRVRLSYWGSSPSACGTTLGEVEDYAIIIKDCNLVTSTDDSGLGSLREALACAESGDTIRFSDHLIGKTISITSKPLLIDKDIVILSNSSDNITVSSIIPQVAFVNTVFNIEAGNTVSLNQFKIVGAYGLNGSGIINAGTLELHDMHVTNGDNTDLESTVLNENGGTIKVLGNTIVE